MGSAPGLTKFADHPFAIDLSKRILIAESVALAVTVMSVLGPRIGLQAALFLGVAILMPGMQVVASVFEADAKRLAFWSLSAFCVAATVFFTITVNRPQWTVKEITSAPIPSVGTIRTPPPAVPPLAAAGIDGAWDKTAPKSAAFVMSDGRTCGRDGDGEDTLTNIRKNRVDVPAAYHEVKWSDIAQVYFPRDKVMPKSLVRWSAADIVKIMQFQDISVSAEGYIAKIRPQAGNKESTNCNATKSADTDWHIAFVEKAGDPEENSVVVETTPRVRASHTAWTIKNLAPWINSQRRVRISGWLLFDPEHKNHLGRFRQTLWEIHPITKIEVQDNDGSWIDLDNLGLLGKRNETGRKQ
jgi:hypothetical protein